MELLEGDTCLQRAGDGQR
jgi:hypothetical protein